MLEMAPRMKERNAMDCHRRASECSANADSVSKKLFGQLVVDEERHCDQDANGIASLRRFGKTYLALRSIERRGTRRVRGGAAAE